MKRRMFIQTLPLLYAPLAFAQLPGSSGGASSQSMDSSQKYFDFQGNATHNPSGSWSLSVRAVLKGSDFTTAIPLTLLIATDPTFSQVIFRQKLIAAPERSFLVTNQYAPPNTSTLLYYKYVVEDAAALKLAGKSSSVASEAKTLSPWRS